MAFVSSIISPRIKRVAAFVAIVWAVAASFIAFDLAALAGFGFVLDTRAGRSLALSDTVRNSTTCVAPVDGANRAGAMLRGDAAVRAWVLGVMVGTHAMTSRWEHAGGAVSDDSLPRWRVLARERAAQTARNIEQLATELSVPKPGRFTEQERADANTAYVALVEADAQGTARAIAAAFSESACHLYKLGAYWGYAAEVRIALPVERSIFAVEIEHHARLAGLPEDLWAPALGATRSNASAEQLAAEMQQQSLAVTTFLQNNPR